jgi:lipopolysaccharide export system ATP-binding protein
VSDSSPVSDPLGDRGLLAGAAGTPDTVFRADSICVSFGERAVLHSASLWGRRGRITVVFGRNGSGKSTLFRCASGVMQPDQGVVLFDGRAFTRPRLHALGRLGLFYLPERDLLVRGRSVRWHLDAAARRFGGDPAPHIAALLLQPLLESTTDQLSGGERRRAELAIALTRQPRCLLADEPFMGIAPVDIDMVAAAFRRLAAAGCAVLISGHEVPALLDLADEVVWLTAGTTRSLGGAAAAWENWHFRREYMGLRAEDSRTTAG